jgi:hypothetical protein
VPCDSRSSWYSASVGIPLLSPRLRAVSLLFALTAWGYDARYGYPAFGPLAAAAALGAWALIKRVQRR